MGQSQSGTTNAPIEQRSQGGVASSNAPHTSAAINVNTRSGNSSSISSSSVSSGGHGDGLSGSVGSRRHHKQHPDSNGDGTGTGSGGGGSGGDLSLDDLEADVRSYGAGSPASSSFVDRFKAFAAPSIHQHSGSQHGSYVGQPHQQGSYAGYGHPGGGSNSNSSVASYGAPWLYSPPKSPSDLPSVIATAASFTSNPGSGSYACSPIENGFADFAKLHLGNPHNTHHLHFDDGDASSSAANHPHPPIDPSHAHHLSSSLNQQQQQAATAAAIDAALQATRMVLLPTVFHWSHGGQQVYVTGAFNNWAAKIPMSRSLNDFSLILDIPPGRYEYRYIVDDEWRYAPDQTVVSDSHGQVSNMVVIDPPRPAVHSAIQSAVQAARAALEPALPSSSSLSSSSSQSPSQSNSPSASSSNLLSSSSSASSSQPNSPSISSFTQPPRRSDLPSSSSSSSSQSHHGWTHDDDHASAFNRPYQSGSGHGGTPFMEALHQYMDDPSFEQQMFEVDPHDGSATHQQQLQFQQQQMQQYQQNIQYQHQLFQQYPFYHQFYQQYMHGSLGVGDDGFSNNSDPNQSSYGNNSNNGGYSQIIPSADQLDFSKDPPILPPHIGSLQHLMLNAPADLHPDPYVLPAPQTVTLHHIFSSTHKRDEIRVLAITQRFKDKFVTTVLYKPNLSAGAASRSNSSASSSSSSSPTFSASSS